MNELQDITQHLLRFSPDAMIVVDERGTIRFANETVAELFGYAPAALIGQPIHVLIPARLHGRHAGHTAGFMQAPRNREMGAKISDLFAVRADGSEFAAGIRLAPFEVGGKKFVAAAVRDTTERRQINEALMSARDEADRANRAKSRFLATASHDLRQPMQAIRLLNAAMLKTVPQPDARELLRRQEQAIDSMTRLLNALLDISRLESGAVELKPVAVPLVDIFEELHAEFDSVARARGLRLQIDPVDIVLSTDRTLFYQLLQNLVGNAVKYTDRGSVSVSCAFDGEDSLMVIITDTGIGIPTDKLERIFDEYYQVDTHGAKRMGVGLGLAIVKEVARLLGFSVKISSRVGEGTQARISLPRHLLMAAEIRSDVAPEHTEKPTHKARLILIEDNDGVRLATELFLKLEGYEILSVASMAEMERLLSRLSAHDVIIADYHLDDKNTGLDVLDTVRRHLRRELPGIILSGDLPSVLRALKEPVPNCRFLSKPVDTRALLAAIGELSVEPVLALHAR
jgi:two-component system, sensor histidine kinase